MRHAAPRRRGMAGRLGAVRLDGGIPLAFCSFSNYVARESARACHQAHVFPSMCPTRE